MQGALFVVDGCRELSELVTFSTVLESEEEESSSRILGTPLDGKVPNSIEEG